MWQAIAAAAIAAAMQRIQEKRSGEAHQKVLGQAEQSFQQMESAGMEPMKLNPNIGIGAGKSGFLGSMMKSMAMSKISGAMSQGGAQPEGPAKMTATEMSGRVDLDTMRHMTPAIQQAQFSAANLQKFGWNKETLQNFMKAHMLGQTEQWLTNWVSQYLKSKKGGKK